MGVLPINMNKGLFILKRRLLATCLAILFLALTPTVQMKADTKTQAEFTNKAPINSPMFENTAGVYITLSFSGTDAVCGAQVTGLTGTTVSATVFLEQKVNGVYEIIKVWNGLSSTNNLFIFDGRYQVTKGYTYRLTIYANVYRNGTVEAVSNYVENTLN